MNHKKNHKHPDGKNFVGKLPNGVTVYGFLGLHIAKRDYLYDTGTIAQRTAIKNRCRNIHRKLRAYN